MPADPTTPLSEPQRAGGYVRGSAGSSGSSRFPGDGLVAAIAMAAYRLASMALTPLVRLHLRRRRASGREHPTRYPERRGEAGAPQPDRPTVWFHAASVGEAVSILPLVTKLSAEWPGLAFLLTTGTVTSAEVVQPRLPPGVVHQFVPADCPVFVDRFLAHWRPSVAVLVESEIWPNLLTRTHAIGCTLALVNGSLSARSFAGWRRIAPLARHLFGLFDVVLAQSSDDCDRLRTLGAHAPATSGNLKQALPPPPVDPVALSSWQKGLEGRPCWLAASTHEGEEEIVARTHVGLTEHHDRLVTLLAPRHPQRGAAIAKTLRGMGLRVALRSDTPELPPNTDVYIADTVGEMGLWYRLAEVVFVGGSLVPKGGHSPSEPASLNCAIICGPHAAKNAGTVAEMKSSGALRQIGDEAALADTVSELLSDGGARAQLIASSQAFAATQQNVLQRVALALTPSFAQAERNATPRYAGP